MPKICAFRSFLYQSIRKRPVLAINHQVIHKICGRHFSLLVCNLPIEKMGFFMPPIIIAA